MICEFEDKIFTVQSPDFEEISLELFRFQYKYNATYQQYAQAIGRDPGKVKRLHDIPFLPVNFFKTHVIKTGSFDAEQVFESSGTTQTVNSRHYVKDLGLYRKSFIKAFEEVYGAAGRKVIIGLLPSYLERNNSSLVLMVDNLISKSGHPGSGFYLYEWEKLAALLQRLEDEGRPAVLIGVTFALLDFAERFPIKLHHTIVMETGGMKGRKREMTREEVHDLLKKAFSVKSIHAEYGMTELLSQAYSTGEGLFRCPPWMKIVLREEDDPLKILSSTSYASGAGGVINVIDLANMYSCCFIATDDIGRIYPDGSFNVLGRMDVSDLRGCSLMIANQL